MAKQTGTISVTIEYDDDDGETMFFLPSGFPDKLIVVEESPTGELSAWYKTDPKVTLMEEN